MSAILNFKIDGFSTNIKKVIVKIFNSLDISDINDTNKDNVLINKILENPNDEVLFNETVEFLKKHREIKEKEISLSNNDSLIISIE